MNKKEIIELLSKTDFEDFLKFDIKGEVLELFDEEGINILKNSKIKQDRIRYILYYSPYKNELLQKEEFLDVFLTSDINEYYAVLKELDKETYNKIFERCGQLKLSDDIIARLFSYIDTEYKIQVIESKQINQNLIINIFNKSYDPKVIQKILDTYNIDLSDERIQTERLFEKGKKAALKKQAVDSREDTDITINPNLITNDLAKKIWESNDIFKYRRVVNNALYSTDASVLNEYAKKQEEQLINTSTNETLFYPFDKIYESYKTYQEQEYNSKQDHLNYDNNLHRESFYEFRKLCETLDIRNLRQKIENIFIQDNIEGVYTYLKQLSDEKISNYIIDYHFEENYYNIMIDMNELLQYYYDGNIVIDKERLNLYEKIVNIDLLTNEEKKELHENLKKYNMMELFYDDMRISRDMVAETIKEYSLSKETIQEYKDEELTKKYGVDVYNVNGNPFFGIVKTGRHVKDRFPTGHSYSLVGGQGLAVFGDVHDSNTYLYDSSTLNKEQIVHVYPFDSYTIYRPYYYREEPSMRVNTLMTPEDLVSYSNAYNEILILEEGTEETEIDKHIPELESIALYCIDNISQKDIEVAKQRGIGIILVDSSKYEKVQKSKYERNRYRESDYNYFDGSYEKEKHEQVRRNM